VSEIRFPLLHGELVVGAGVLMTYGFAQIADIHVIRA
jgi:hypothetical protein